MSDQNPILEIDEAWLKSSGFKWHQFDRQPSKQWLLWLGDVVSSGGFDSFEDLGVEVSAHTTRWKGSNEVPEYIDYWNSWLRADYSGRYSRFIHIRILKFRHELISLIEGVTGHSWNPALNIGGCMRTVEQAHRLRLNEERMDVRMLRPTWREIEKDDTRGRALPEHMQGSIDGGEAK